LEPAEGRGGRADEISGALNRNAELNKNNVRLEIIGQVYRCRKVVQEHLRKSIATLSKNNGLT